MNLFIKGTFRALLGVRYSENQHDPFRFAARYSLMNLGPDGLSIVEFIFGDVGSYMGDLICIGVVLMHVTQIQFTGLAKKNLVDFENIYEGYFRLKKNNQFLDLFTNTYNKENLYLKMLENLKQGLFCSAYKFYKTKKSLYNDTNYMKMIANEKYRYFSQQRFMYIVKSIEDHVITVLQDYPYEKTSKTLWRMFSKFNRKTGIDVYGLMTTLQIILLVYTFLFYSRMENSNKSDIALAFKKNNFSGIMLVCCLVIIITIVIERYIYLLNPCQWRDWELFNKDEDPENYKEYLEFFKLKNIKNLTPFQILRKKAIRIHIMLKFSKLTAEQFHKLLQKKQKFLASSKKDDKSNYIKDFKYNPLWIKFLFQIVVMIIASGIIFIWLPLKGNDSVNGTIFCNNLYQPPSKDECNYISDNIFIWIYYCLYVMYFMLGALQFKQGESFLKRQKQYRWNLLEKLKLLVIKNTPFIYQVKTCLDWSATTTSLGLFDWFKYLDVYYKLLMSKFKQNKRDKNQFGQKRSRLEKIIFGWLGVAIILIILFAPLLWFCDFNPTTTTNTINNMGMNLNLQLGSSTFNLYSNTHAASIESITDEEYKMYFSTDKLTSNRFDQDKIQIISTYPFSENYWQITTPMLNNLKEMIYEYLSNKKQMEAKFGLYLNLDQKSGANTFVNNTETISAQQLLGIYESLSKCSSTSIMIEN